MTPHKVVVHVYDVTNIGAISGLNQLTRDKLGSGGLFHTAVEVDGASDGLEYCFGHRDSGTGVSANPARKCTQHKYRESLEMGSVTTGKSELAALISRLKDEWPGATYHAVKRNCCTFANALCVRSFRTTELAGWQQEAMEHVHSLIDKEHKSRQRATAARGGGEGFASDGGDEDDEKAPGEEKAAGGSQGRQSRSVAMRHVWSVPLRGSFQPRRTSSMRGKMCSSNG